MVAHTDPTRSKVKVRGHRWENIHTRENILAVQCIIVHALTRLNKSRPEFEAVKKLQPHVFSVFVEFFALKRSVGATSTEF